MKINLYLHQKHTVRNGKISLSELVDLVPERPDLQRYLHEQTMPVPDYVGTVNLVTVLKKLTQAFPQYDFQSIGESVCTIVIRKKQKLSVLSVIKLVFLLSIAFFGGAMAIMNFHADVDMPEVFAQMNDFYTGGTADILSVSIPYAAGVGAGFLFILKVFKKKDKNHPSMVDLNLAEHEQEVQDYIAGE